jgi:group I intron endonuclease
MNKEIGIYWIRNKITNKRYIGGSIELKKRIRAHKNLLKRGVHINYLLQEEFDKCNLEDFEFKVLLNCPERLLDTIERSFIEFYKDNCYNLDSGGKKEFSRDESTRNKIGKANSGENHYLFGGTGENHPMFGITGEKNPRFGRTHSDEARQKISKAMSGDKNPNFGRTGDKHPMYGMTGEKNPRYIPRTPEMIEDISLGKTKWMKKYGMSKTVFYAIKKGGN